MNDKQRKVKNKESADKMFSLVSKIIAVEENLDSNFTAKSLIDPELITKCKDMFTSAALKLIDPNENE